MRTHSPLVLDVRELLEHHGVRKQLSFDVAVPDLASGPTATEGEVHLDLTLEAIDGGSIVVRAEASGSYGADCRRCVTPVREDFRYRGTEVYRPVSDAWEEGYVIKDLQIDLETLVRDLVVLNLPSTVLCRDDCKGLCTKCGKDLSEGPCGCADEQFDPRWAALKDFKPQSG